MERRLPKVKWVRAEWAGVTLRLRVEEGTPPPEAEPFSVELPEKTRFPVISQSWATLVPLQPEYA